MREDVEGWEGGGEEREDNKVRESVRESVRELGGEGTR